MEEQQARRVEAQPQKRRAVIRVESEETQDFFKERCSSGYPSEEEVEEIGFVPSAVGEPLWALHLCDNECSAGLQALPARGYCVERRWCCSHIQLVQAVLQRQASSTRRTASESSTVERNDGAESVSWQAVEGIWNGTVYVRDV